MERKTLAVDGLSCTGCESRLETALERVPGVRRVEADHTDGTVDVVAEPGTDLRDGIRSAGYDVAE